MGRLHDRSTEAWKKKLATPRSRDVVEAHAGVASVGTDGGIAPRQHDCAGDCADANAKFNQTAQGPREVGYLGNKTKGR
jgi:hypothetical protein